MKFYWQVQLKCVCCGGANPNKSFVLSSSLKTTPAIVNLASDLVDNTLFGVIKSFLNAESHSRTSASHSQLRFSKIRETESFSLAITPEENDNLVFAKDASLSLEMKGFDTNVELIENGDDMTEYIAEQQQNYVDEIHSKQ